jgi:hypothetical protein
VSYLRETLGVDQIGWRDTLTVRVQDANKKVFFGLPDVTRTSFVGILDDFPTVVPLERAIYGPDGPPRPIAAHYLAKRCAPKVLTRRRPEKRTACELTRSGEEGRSHDASPFIGQLIWPTSRHEDRRKQRKSHQVLPAGDRAPLVAHHSVRSSRTRDWSRARSAPRPARGCSVVPRHYLHHHLSHCHSHPRARGTLPLRPQRYP